jgi:hypothetical protein
MSQSKSTPKVKEIQPTMIEPSARPPVIGAPIWGWLQWVA